MARNSKSTTKPIKPEADIQESLEEPAAVIEPTTPTISKAEAVRVAMSAGKELPGDIHDFVLKKFGHDIPKQTISSYKAQEKLRQAKKEANTATATPGRKPKAARPIIEGYLAPPEKTKATGEPDVLLALEGIKDLVGQFGADKVKRMVDLIG